MPIRSYVRSTDYHRKPCGENILCGIDISVVVRPTFRAIPLSDIKRQFINNVTAASTAFRAGKPSVNFNQRPTVPLALVFQLTNQFTPASISNGCTELSVLQHIPHRQILNSNRLVFAYQSSGQLVKEICSLVSCFSMNSSNPTPGLLSIIRAFNFTRQSFLGLSQLQAKAFEAFWIGNFFPIASSNQGGDSCVNPHGLVRPWERLNGRVFHQERDKPSSRGVQSHCDGGGFATGGERAAPSNRQRGRTLCQPQLPILPLKGGTGKLSTAAAMLLLEIGIPSVTSPEVSKSFLQVPQALLQRYAANIIEKLQAFFLLPLGQHCRSLLVVNPLLMFVPSFGSGMQCPVVDQPHATQRAPQELFLFLGWVKAVSVGALSHKSHSTMQRVRLVIKGAQCPLNYPPIPPRPIRAGFPGVFR